MSENLPPFFSGQKVVCLETLGPPMIKGIIVTVHDTFQCPNCKTWHTRIVEFPAPTTNNAGYGCKCGYRHPVSGYFGAPSIYFAPIQENFQSISLTRILEKETELIGSN